MEYILIFLEGVASFISPCVLPMIPIYVSYIVGTKTENGKIKNSIFNSVGFVLGFSIIFIVLSIFASTLGMLVSKYMNILQIIFGIIMVIFGLNFMDAIQIKFGNLSSNMKINHEKTGFLRSLLFGMIFSVTWTPCVGAFLGTALMTIATEGKLLKGIFMMTLYCIGLGIPFIISAVLLDKLKNVFKFIKKNFGTIKKISGIFLILMGLYTIIK